MKNWLRAKSPALGGTLIVLTFGLMAVNARANEVELNTTSYSTPVYSNGSLIGYGGEFIGKETGVTLAPAYSSGVSVLSGNPGTFETFCVELNQDMYGSTWYNYNLSGHINFDGTGNTQQLAAGVAWLYSQFVTGGLAKYGYYYGASGSGGTLNLTRAQSSTDLQNAIWQLMDESLGVSQNGPDESTVDDMTNPFMQAAQAQFGSIDAAEAGAATGSYGVYVMDLYSGTRQLQDQLIMVPDDCITLLLLLGALVGLAFVGPRVRPRTSAKA